MTTDEFYNNDLQLIVAQTELVTGAISVLRLVTFGLRKPTGPWQFTATNDDDIEAFWRLNELQDHHALLGRKTGTVDYPHLNSPMQDACGSQRLPEPRSGTSVIV